MSTISFNRCTTFSPGVPLHFQPPRGKLSAVTTLSVISKNPPITKSGYDKPIAFTPNLFFGQVSKPSNLSMPFLLVLLTTSNEKPDGVSVGFLHPTKMPHGTSVKLLASHSRLPLGFPRTATIFSMDLAQVLFSHSGQVHMFTFGEHSSKLLQASTKREGPGPSPLSRFQKEF